MVKIDFQFNRVENLLGQPFVYLFEGVCTLAERWKHPPLMCAALFILWTNITDLLKRLKQAEHQCTSLSTS